MIYYSDNQTMLEFNVISEGNNFETFAEEVSLTDYRQIQV